MFKRNVMAGWIKIYRDIKCHWIWDNPAYFKAWINILLTVNHEDKKILIEGELIECKRGQSLLSLNSWVKCFGKKWTIQRVRTFFELLKQDEMITTEGLRKTTRLTVCKYEYYQNEQQAKNKQTTSKEQADNKQTTTTKEGRRMKKNIIEENIIKSFEFYVSEGTKAKTFTDVMSIDYVKLCYHLCQKRDGVLRLPWVLTMTNQITHDEFSKLYKKSGNNIELIKGKIDSIQTSIDYHGKYEDLYLLINKWLIPTNEKKFK